MNDAPNKPSRPPWVVRRSPNFIIRFLPDSPAERDAALIADRLEAIRDATIRALDLGNPVREPIEVFLSDMPDFRSRLGEEQNGAEEMTLPALRVLAVYTSDMPGETLERDLVEMLLTPGLATSTTTASFLIDGLVGYVALLSGFFSPDKLDAAFAGLRGGMVPSLADVMRGPTEESSTLYHSTVTSFVAFLLEAYGPERFKQFVREFATEAPNRAAEVAYGKPMPVLEQEWRAVSTERSAPTLGMMWVLRQSFAYLRPYWIQEMSIIVGSFIGAAFTIILPLSSKFLIDRAILPKNLGLLAIILGALVGFFVFQSLVSLGEDYLSARVSAGVLNDLRLKVFDHLQRLSMGFYSRSEIGDIMSRLTDDLLMAQSALTSVIPALTTLLLSFGVSAVILFFLEWRLALLCALALPLLFLGPALFGKRAAGASYQQQEDAGKVASVAQENLGAQPVIKSFGLQEEAVDNFREEIGRLARSTLRSSFLGSMMGTTAGLSISFVQMLALGVGAFMVIRGNLSLGSLVAFQGLLGNVTGPLGSISGIMQMLQQASGGMRRVNELLEEQPEVAEEPDAEPLPRFGREVRFDGVEFGYTGEQVVLHRVDLKILAGQSVALVGPSGSGKSTVLNLLLRFYDPTRGSVGVDGHDLRRVTQESLRDQLGAVFQDTFLFNATVRENIRLGKLDATDEEVEEAARAAEIHHFVQGMPQGYDTVVGERGGRLSGGQRQRIALARAILRDPAILVLDEPTSALDPQTEAAVNATLRKLAADRTTVIATHRLASVTNADRLVVLEGGRVVEQGTHQELINARGLYSRLWEQQQGFITDAGRVGVKPDRLRKIPFFKSLDGVLLAAVANNFVTERYAEGQVVFEEGDPGDRLYIVVRGEVEVVASGPTGEEQRLAVLEDGEYFGEMALLREVPRMASVRARAPTTLLGLSREQFLDLLENIPDLRDAFERTIELRHQANLIALRELTRRDR